jgi:hypothetical protein
MALIPKILKVMEGIKMVRRKIMMSFFCLLAASFRFSSISDQTDLHTPLFVIHIISELNVKEV